MSLASDAEHYRRMATAEHKPECPSLTAVEPYWPPGGWAPIDAEGNWCTGPGIPTGLGWLGPKPEWSPPSCPGCNPPADRALFARLADEVDAHLAPQPDLFGGESVEPVSETVAAVMLALGRWLVALSATGAT